MTEARTTQPVASDTLRTPDGTLYYESRGSGPLVALVGAPMDAAAFAPLADLLAADHTVLTTDPRGVGRSVLDDPGQDSTPALRAADLARLVEHLDAGPAAVLGSSGGAVTALALVESRPDLVTAAIAHEPPLVELLPDRDELHAGTRELIATYASGDVPGAWGQFLRQANIYMPDELVAEIFAGERSAQTVSDQDHWFHHELLGTTAWRPDLDVLRSAATRIVIGIGADSAGQLCDRASRALGSELGLEPTIFPGDHTGFVDDPAAFAERLRGVLAA
ncbi:alpha/beta hydrolase fold protein [Beutenbergia cavernae DSM 12333]|uniref:Alpha/beta hydrolase fold protein n=1 Tax=Beutenbergia cavernae (strain ATCC BAA-8 / DSM 12333 / CCUG 43141 / JCM 11478 / NBRC 16432 / NCIMB 13614 / HKI 0122) TaxID=471853 RepID=C5C1A0_BEUC1|nr:alpha/beta hydrolase [Beutenbergia cavernae]ACQ81510.1 alpha/beta hydrolase fold protein [Beutenbergia cavernae DSM 12333]